MVDEAIEAGVRELRLENIGCESEGNPRTWWLWSWRTRIVLIHGMGCGERGRARGSDSEGASRAILGYDLI